MFFSSFYLILSFLLILFVLFLRIKRESNVRAFFFESIFLTKEFSLNIISNKLGYDLSVIFIFFYI